MTDIASNQHLERCDGNTLAVGCCVGVAAEILNSLKLSPEARSVASASMPGRMSCESCGRGVRLYCARCVWSAVPLPPPVRLGIQVHILRHPKEPAEKSSAVPLPLLAMHGEVKLHDFPMATDDATALTHEPGTWLLYPSSHSVDASVVDWGTVSRLVLIDSRWQHAGAVLSQTSGLHTLPMMHLTGGRSRFWRSASEKLPQDAGLLSTAECLHAALLARRAALPSEEDTDCALDDLLLFFALRHRIIAERYAGDPMRACCPHCQEAARRSAVHRGNATKKSAKPDPEATVSKEAKVSEKFSHCTDCSEEEAQVLYGRKLSCTATDFSFHRNII